jgi:hypothetical protein
MEEKFAKRHKALSSNDLRRKNPVRFQPGKMLASALLSGGRQKNRRKNLSSWGVFVGLGVLPVVVLGSDMNLW